MEGLLLWLSLCLYLCLCLLCLTLSWPYDIYPDLATSKHDGARWRCMQLHASGRSRAWIQSEVSLNDRLPQRPLLLLPLL